MYRIKPSSLELSLLFFPILIFIRTNINFGLQEKGHIEYFVNVAMGVKMLMLRHLCFPWSWCWMGQQTVCIGLSTMDSSNDLMLLCQWQGNCPWCSLSLVHIGYFATSSHILLFTPVYTCAGFRSLFSLAYTSLMQCHHLFVLFKQCVVSFRQRKLNFK